MAIAPEHTGIGIRRHFTKPGVHPYDQVEWERRDARITNFRDGTVALDGPPALTRGFHDWFVWSPFAPMVRERLATAAT